MFQSTNQHGIPTLEDAHRLGIINRDALTSSTALLTEEKAVGPQF
jgi:hypothetical protein